MNIEILEFIEGAKQAKGLVVIIDVFRAFSVACYAFDSGAARVIATESAAKAFELKSKYKNVVLAGEKNEKKIEGFDFGNSPTEILKNDLTGMTFIHTTTAGTRGLTNAINAGELVTGSLVNAGAVTRYIESVNAKHISLVAMGFRATSSADEDLLCAKIISKRLNKTPFEVQPEIDKLRDSSGRRFFIPENIDFSPPSDFFLCTMIDRFNFVLKAFKRPDGNVDLMRMDI